MATLASKVEIHSEDITVAIIKTYRQRHGPTTEARLTTVVQAACEAAAVHWRFLAGIIPMTRSAIITNATSNKVLSMATPFAQGMYVADESAVRLVVRRYKHMFRRVHRLHSLSP